MSDIETTENFWKVWNSFEWPEPNLVFYRLYHDANGHPEFYTMEDLPGNWIEVDRETYVNGSWDVRVVDGKLIKIKPRVVIDRLTPDEVNGTACHPRDITVIVAEDSPHTKWSMTSNEID